VGLSALNIKTKFAKNICSSVLKIAKNSSSKLLIHLNPQIEFFNNENMNIQQNIV